MRSIRALALLMGVLAGLSLCAPAAQALVIPMDIPDLTQAAQQIVVGQVQDMRATWGRARREIFTIVRLTVEETLAGPPAPRRIVVRVPGGRIGDVLCVVSDVPRFTPGERCVLFLGPGHCPTVGGWQGKKTLIGDRIVGDGRGLGDLRAFIRGMGPDAKAGPRRRLVQPMGQFAPGGGLPPGGVQTRATETILNETFEGTWPSGSWSRTGNPTWGKDDSKDHSGLYSAYCARSGSLGVDPEFSDYPNNCDSIMKYGPFDLSDASSAQLSFWDLVRTENDKDFIYWEASADGQNWSGSSLDGSFAFWFNDTLDLTPYCGDNSVWVRFRFTSDASGRWPGVWVDDVVITKELGTAPFPVISSIAPGHAFAGTGYEITIGGSNFGATQDSGKVLFYQSTDRQLKAASYTSWSNAQIQCTVPKDASSGSVTVWTPTGASSNGYHLDMTFGYGGIKWYAADIPVDFYVNPNTTDCTGEEAAVSSAASTWNSNGGYSTTFSFSYQGTTSSGYGQDGQNTCLWATGLSSGTIAVNTTWYYVSTDQIAEFDIRFNDADYTWSTASSTPGGAMDVETIALHELGHSLQLTDLYGSADSSKTMYGFGSTGTQDRTLHNADNSGAYWIYPRAPTPVRLANGQAILREPGTLLRFLYSDPRPLAEFQVYRRAESGDLQRIGSVPYTDSGVNYEYLDTERRAAATDYRIGCVGLYGQVELFELFPLPPR